MLRKPYKTIEQENGTIKIFGNNHEIEIEYKKPEWSNDDEAFFKYKGNDYFLCEFMIIDSGPFKGQGFDGYLNNSFFSGVLVKYTNDYEAVKAYTYIS